MKIQIRIALRMHGATIITRLLICVFLTELSFADQRSTLEVELEYNNEPALIMTHSIEKNMRRFPLASLNAFIVSCSVCAMLCSGIVVAGDLDPQQSEWHRKYKGQENAPKPEAMLLNVDPEPELKTGFVSMFNGKDLTGWTSKGGVSKYTAKDGILTGTCVPGTDSTYLCTEKSDYTDFVFTCEMKWEVNANSGVMFRSQVKSQKDKEIVFGPQAEMEGEKGDRGWSGGIYGQSCGGFFYPLWLTEHNEARAALKPTDWNRLTIMAKGDMVKTWVNGVPAAHWVDNGTYAKGAFGLQIHKGIEGTVLWRNLRVKELKP